jgi:hypothetical protein
VARGAEEPRTATALTSTTCREEELRKAAAGRTTITRTAATARRDMELRAATTRRPTNTPKSTARREEATGEITTATRTAPEGERGTSTPAVGPRTGRKKARAARDEKSAGEGMAGGKVDEADTEGGMWETNRSGRRRSCSSS